MATGNVENFAIIVLINGRTSQVKLTKSQKQLFAKLTLGALSESDQIQLMPIDDMVKLEPDHEAFSTD
ncbi:TPA: hypothetical protein QDZ66_000611 [Pluralibacter gergoviae]|uniref:hypothetical protein n=1 Tax=Pluralibacter gergoviae TaxID=61647 RepID=UPI000650F859|nr:hypothetical protein [Pluralibacter gergoviae]KMK14517.1 hypothetical protein ABW10_25320 [Pluralibacter gergoviae]MBL3696030.1 hypothetical protein [Pluralibacter gergoviae]HDS1149897.1 hypothetical protein [Pluralibacter gergoviae]